MFACNKQNLLKNTIKLLLSIDDPYHKFIKIMFIFDNFFV